MCRCAASASRPMPSAPDWEAMPTAPGGGEAAPNVAFSRMPAVRTATPRQLGPTSRTPAARAVRSSCRSRSAPSVSVSPKPADRMTAAGMPRSPQSRITCSTAGPGTATIARSTGSGSASTDG